MDPRDAASRPVDNRARYTELDAERDQQPTVVSSNVDRTFRTLLSSTIGAVNTTPDRPLSLV